MAFKQLLFESAAREKILRGATALADAVRVTLGPRSRSVLIERRWGRPIVCNDGVTIAKEVDLADAEENLGARMMREAAERTGDAVGDGTSTSTVLAYAIFAEGLRNVVAGASAVDLRRGLERGSKAAIASLRALARPVGTRQEKAQVATISAHNDESIGNVVGEAVERVGAEGVVAVEEAKGTETTLEVLPQRLAASGREQQRARAVRCREVVQVAEVGRRRLGRGAPLEVRADERELPRVRRARREEVPARRAQLGRETHGVHCARLADGAVERHRVRGGLERERRGV